MMHLHFPQKAAFALHGERRLLNQRGTPEKKPTEAELAASRETLAGHLNKAITANPDLKTALKETVLGFLKQAGQKDQSKIRELRDLADDAITRLDGLDISAKDLRVLKDAIPTDEVQLSEVAEKAGFLTRQEAFDAIRNGAQASAARQQAALPLPQQGYMRQRPRETNGPVDLSGLSNQQLETAIKNVRKLLRSQAAGAAPGASEQAMAIYRALDEELLRRTNGEFNIRSYVQLKEGGGSRRSPSEIHIHHAPRETNFQRMLRQKRRINGPRTFEEGAIAEEAARWRGPRIDEDSVPMYEVKQPGRNFMVWRNNPDGSRYSARDEWEYYNNGGTVDNFRPENFERRAEQAPYRSQFNGARVDAGLYNQAVRQGQRWSNYNPEVQRNLRNYSVGKLQREIERKMNRYLPLANHPDPVVRNTYAEIWDSFEESKLHPYRSREMDHTLNNLRDRLDNLVQNAEYLGLNESVSGKALAVRTTRIVGRQADAGVRITGISSINGKPIMMTINDPRMWGRGMYASPAVAEIAKDFGIRVTRDFRTVHTVGGEAQPAGMKIEFTKPGTFILEGEALNDPRPVVIPANRRAPTSPENSSGIPYETV